MIENVFTINDFRKEGLEKAPEYWQSADFEEVMSKAVGRVVAGRGYEPHPNMKLIRELSFMVKSVTTVSQLRLLADKIKTKYNIDCFQISIDRENSTAHMLFDYLDDNGKIISINWLQQIKMSVMILRTLNLPRPKSVREWLRYFVTDSYEDDPQIFQKQMDALEHGDIKKINMPFLRDVLLYAEAMCKGQAK